VRDFSIPPKFTATTLPQRILKARSRLAGGPPDITVTPKVGDIGLFDFHRAGEAISLGVKAAEKQIEEIKHAIRALAA